MPLLALMDDFGLRRDRAAPGFEQRKARQLLLTERQEPVQLLDQGARGRCDGTSSSGCSQDHGPANQGSRKRHDVEMTTTLD